MSLDPRSARHANRRVVRLRAESAPILLRPILGSYVESPANTDYPLTVLNDLDRLPLVMDTIDRLPQTGDHGLYLKQQLKDKLIVHKQYIDKHGEDLPEIRDWKWNVSIPAAIDQQP